MIPDPFSAISLSANIVANLATDILKHRAQALEDTRIGGLLRRAGLIEPGFNDRLHDTLSKALDQYFRSNPRYCLSCVISFFRDPATTKQIGEYILNQQPINEVELQGALDRAMGDDPVTRILVKQRQLDPSRIVRDFLDHYRKVLSWELSVPDMAILLGMLNQTHQIVAEIRDSERRTKEHLERSLRASQVTTDETPSQSVDGKLSSSLDELLHACKLQVQNEIQSAIGGKYIPALYVEREAGEKIEEFLAKKPANALPYSQQARHALENYLDAIQATKADIKQRTIPTDPSKPHRELSSTEKRRIEQLDAEFEEVTSLRPVLEDLQSLLKATNPVVSEVRSALERVVSHAGCAGEIRTSVGRIQLALRNCLLITDAAGRGKTNLACALAMKQVAHQPTVIIASGTLRLEDTFGLERYVQASLGILSELTVQTFMQTLTEVAEEADSDILVIVDAINENRDTALLKSALQALISKNNDKRFKFIVTCRDIYWNGFLHANGDFWDEYVWHKMELGDFTEDEFAQVLPLYFQRFGIRAQLSAEAKSKLRHPLLLRFFCEAYREKGALVYLGEFEDIRLKQLFDTYWANKVESVRDRLHYRASRPVETFLLLVARKMRFNRDRMLSFQEITRITGEQDFETAGAIYTRVLDEGIILEQTPSSMWHESRVTFVYDEFMEYVMAKELLAWVLNTNDRKVLEIRLERVLKSARRFNSIYGVTSYLLPMLDKERSTGAWDMVYSQGTGWHVPLCKALLRIPPTELTCEAMFVAQKLSKSRDSEVRRQILRLSQDIEAARPDEAVGLYLSLIQDRLPQVYLEARNGLVSLSLAGHASARQGLAGLLGHESSRFRSLAAYALAEVGDLGPTELQLILRDSNSYVREAGIYAVGMLRWNLPTSVFEDALSRGRTDPAVKVRAMAFWVDAMMSNEK